MAHSLLFLTISKEGRLGFREQGGTLAAPTRPLHRSLDLTAGFTTLNSLSSIILFFPFGQGNFDLSFSPWAEINAKGHDGEPFLLRFAQELTDFFSMQK